MLAAAASQGWKQAFWIASLVFFVGWGVRLLIARHRGRPKAPKVQREEIRWILGEEVMERSWYTPGGFVLFHAAVIGWKSLRRTLDDLRQSLRPPPAAKHLAPQRRRLGRLQAANEDRPLQPR